MNGAVIDVAEPGTQPLRRMTTERFLRSHREAGHGAAKAEALLQNRDVEQEILELREVDAGGSVAADLDIAEGEVFVRRRRVLLDDGTPLQLADSYIPLDLAVGAIRERDAGPGGTYARIEEQGHTLTRFRERHWYRAPTPAEAEQLQLGDGEHVIQLHRIAYTGDRPVECFVGVMAASRHMFDYEIEAR